MKKCIFFTHEQIPIWCITISGMFCETFFKLVLQFRCRRYSYLKIHGRRYAKDTHYKVPQRIAVEQIHNGRWPGHVEQSVVGSPSSGIPAPCCQLLAHQVVDVNRCGTLE